MKRTPPASLEAERSLLGSWLLSEEAWDETSAVVEPSDFYSTRHRDIAKACEEAVREYGRADGTTTLEFLRRSGALAEMPADYLTDLMNGTPSPRNAATYARIVKEHSVRRQIVNASQNASAVAMDGGDLEESVDSIVRILRRSDAQGAPTPKTGAELLATPPERIDALTDPPLFVRGGTTVLASETKVGKTNLWLHIAWALTEGKTLYGWLSPLAPVPILLVELDLSEATLHRRLSALKPDLGWNGGLSRLNVWCTRFLQLDTKQGVNKLRQVIQSTVPRPELVIIDNYNAAITGDPDKTNESRRAMLALRELQEELGVAFGLTYEMRKPPPGVKVKYSIHDLKGNNVVAYDADAVLMLRPTDETRRRLELRFPALRHCDDLPDDMVLERKGLTFELARVKNEDDAIGFVREYLKGGGRPTKRECATAARAEGIGIRNEDVVPLIRRAQQELGL